MINEKDGICPNIDILNFEYIHKHNKFFIWQVQKLKLIIIIYQWKKSTPTNIILYLED